MENKNYYDVLEVTMDASPDEIHQGYLQSKNAYSSESLALYSLMTKIECDDILTSIEEAYTILSDPIKREQYDQARGYNANMPRSKRFGTHVAPADSKFEQHRLNQTKSAQTQANSMQKIVANSRSTLDYEVDSEFENEIESMTEYTGEFLQKIREYKGVDIPRMSDLTKVSKTYLRKIEEEDIGNLPASVYVRGFVYQYAKVLKLNPDLVATSYVHRIKKLTGER